MKKKLLNLSIAAALLGGSVVGHAATLNTFSADGILQNFSGFDWHANGAAWIQGFNLTGANTTGDTDTFTLTYQAFAGGIDSTSPTPNLFVAPPESATGTYELTTYQTLNETATCQNVGCTSIQIATTGGTWNVFLDSTPDANQAAGSGFLDGVSILSGNWTSGLSAFTANGAIPGAGVIGTGGGFLNGTVTSTNNTYVNPTLSGTEFQASLQFPGLSSPNFTRPGAFNGVATGANSPTDFVIQTDGSQNYTVPEPGMLALIGVGLLGFGFSRRSRP